MNAWERLVLGSTIPAGTAWEHLNAQGEGGGTYVILADGLEVDTDMDDVVILVDIQQGPTIELETEEFEVMVETNHEVEV